MLRFRSSACSHSPCCEEWNRKHGAMSGVGEEDDDGDEW